MICLEVENATKSYGGLRAADAVSLTLERGEMLALIGPNGAGKSTLFNMIGGQLRPDSGVVRFEGRPISGLPPRVVWRRGVGRTFQIAAAFASMSVVENVQMALISHARGLFDFWRPARARHRARALELLAAVGMSAQADHACAALAYGDVKRLELAMALANDPRLLLMDEPTAGMAPGERRDMMRLTRRLAKERDIAVLFTEHSMDAVFGYADRILVLARGRIVAEGSPDAVRRDPQARAVYFGAADVARAIGEAAP